MDSQAHPNLSSRLRPRDAIFLVAIIVLLGISVLGLFAAPQRACAKGLSDYNLITDYCYKSLITITKSTAGDLTNYGVRLTINSGQLIGQRFIGSRHWDLRPVTTGLQVVEATTQDTTSNSGSWWVRVPSIPGNSEASLWLYMGNNKGKRDQGFFMTGSDTLTVTDNASLDVTDNFEVVVKVDAYTAAGAIQNTWLVNKWTASTGYRLGLANVGGVATIRAQVDGSSNLDVNWDTTLAEDIIIMRYQSPNLYILTCDGILLTNCTTDGTLNTGLGAITANAANLTMGDTLTGSLRHVELRTNAGTTRDRVAVWGFDPVDITETSAANPTFQGTVTAAIGGASMNAAYSISRSQSNLSITVGPFASTLSEPAVSITPTPSNVLGSYSSTNLFTKATTRTFFPGYQALEDARTKIGFPEDAWWFLALGFVGSLLAIVIFIFSRRYPLAALGLVGMWVYGGVTGLLAPYIPVIAGLAALSIWLMDRLGRE